jgi:NADH-quinone oxidoreductase subunit G
MGKALPFDSLGALREQMAQAHPVFATLDDLVPSEWGAFGAADGALGEGGFAPAIANFYMTCPISRASATMAECTTVFVNGGKEATGTDG